METYSFYGRASFIDAKTGLYNYHTCRIFDNCIYCIVNNNPEAQRNADIFYVLNVEKKLRELAAAGNITNLIFSEPLQIEVKADGTYNEIIKTDKR